MEEEKEREAAAAMRRLGNGDVGDSDDDAELLVDERLCEESDSDEEGVIKPVRATGADAPMNNFEEYMQQLRETRSKLRIKRCPTRQYAAMAKHMQQSPVETQNEKVRQTLKWRTRPHISYLTRLFGFAETRGPPVEQRV